MTTLTNLIERVEHRAKGNLEQDHDEDALNLAIWRALVYPTADISAKWRDAADQMNDEEFRSWASYFAGYGINTKYTSSIDAIRWLIDKNFPKHLWGVARREQPYFGWGEYRASIRIEDDVNRLDDVIEHGVTPALALCLALLRSKLSESPLASEGVSAAGESET